MSSTRSTGLAARCNATGLALALSLTLPLAPASAQLVHGTVSDADNGNPVPIAGVYLLDRDREPVVVAMADSLGRYRLTVPAAGEYVLFVQRFGYFELETPLLSISVDRDYPLDLELRAEPFALPGIDVTVRNETTVRRLTLELGVNPASLPGFRIIQGDRFAEARIRGQDNPTNTLRWLFIPVRHGMRCVSINSLPRPERRGAGASGAPRPGQAPVGTRRRGERDEAPGRGCGVLFIDELEFPNAHIDEIDLSTIAVVVTLPGTVRMYTYDWVERHGR